MSDCCLTPIISWREQVMRWWWSSLSGGSLKQQSVGTHVIYLDTLSWFRANQSFLFLLYAACLVEKQQILILMSGLIQVGLEFTICCTRSKHASHYTTDVTITSLTALSYQTHCYTRNNYDKKVLNSDGQQFHQ
jgi:hypothetical protein